MEYDFGKVRNEHKAVDLKANWKFSFILTMWIFINNLVCAKHCSRHPNKQSPCPHRAYILMEGNLQ